MKTCGAFIWAKAFASVDRRRIQVAILSVDRGPRFIANYMRCLRFAHL